MAVDDFNPDDLEELAQLLRDVEGIETADIDPSKVRTPGVWVRFDGLSLGTLGALGVKVTLHPVVASTGNRPRDLAGLAALFNRVKPVAQQLGAPLDDVRVVALTLPGSSTPLACLQIPIELHTTQEE